MNKRLLSFFDKLEDKTRSRLSHLPILYAFLAGIGVVLFWRGVWHTTDFLTAFFLGEVDLTLFSIADGPLSFAMGTTILLVTGVYVSAFIGNRLIITGLSGEKKLAEKTEEEILSEEDELQKIKKTLDRVENEIMKIEDKIR